MKVYKICNNYFWFIDVINDSPDFCKYNVVENEGTIFYSLDDVFYFLESYCNDQELYLVTRKEDPVKNKYDWIPKEWKIVEFELSEKKKFIAKTKFKNAKI